MSDKPTPTIRQADFPQDHKTITALFNAYAKSLQMDLSYQGFEAELALLPGKYSEPNGGALFLAAVPSAAWRPTHPSGSKGAEPGSSSAISPPEEHVIGCVALRALQSPDTCELKRLYIVPESRGLGAGRKLLERVIGTARRLGYKLMVLDTLPHMVAARTMYKAHGFVETESYYETPIEETVFMRLSLE